MNINCISCGHKVTLDHTYDDYEGPVRCLICSTLLEIKAEEGYLKSVALTKVKTSSPAAGEVYEQTN